MVILKGQRLVQDNDYATKKDAFFTMSALRINIFDKKNADSLVNSKSMAGLSNHVDVLKGSKNCLFFHDSNNRHHNISMCIDNKNTTNQILDTFDFFTKCSVSVVKSLSKTNSLEILLNTLNDPEQDLYKIPNFKRALTDSLKSKGVNKFIYFDINFSFSFLFLIPNLLIRNLIAKQMLKRLKSLNLKL